MKKAIKRTIWLVAAFFMLSISVSASGYEPYEGYQYDAWNETISSPNCYEAIGCVNGELLGIGPMNNPSDMYVRGSLLYIADTGNNRIIVLNDRLELIRVMDTFTDINGASVKLNGPQGIFVSANGTMLVADTGNQHVLSCREDGSKAVFIKKPLSDIFPDNIEFRPLRVVMNSSGDIYVLVKDFYYGAVAYNSSGRFRGYFGASKVEVTAKLLFTRFWRKLMSEKQSSYMSYFVPVAYSSFDIDDEDTIYTCTALSSTSKGEIRRFNSMGINILRVEDTGGVYNKSDYGDKERISYRGAWLDTRFVDIDVADTGFFNALDSTQGRIFQYDPESNLIAIFGGYGDQIGTFKRPVALESIGDTVLVLDADNGDVTIFSTTDYGAAVHKADALYIQGLYDQSVDAWKDVLRLNSNFELAYRGLGKALANQGEYDAAMWNFCRGADREGYSQVFSIIRSQFIHSHFMIFGMFAFMLIAAALFGSWLLALLRKKAIIPPPVNSSETPLYVMFHPLSGFDNIRRTKRFSLLVGAILLSLLWFFAAVFEYECTGFIFNLNPAASLNIWLMIAKTIGLLFVWVLCNWSISTLLDGEGSIGRIWIVSAYALTPYILSIIITTVFSNVTTQPEGALVSLLSYVGIIWSVFLMYIGIKEVHQFSGLRTAVSMLLTVVGIMVILFILLLSSGLIQQLITFIGTVTSEIMFRNK